MVLAFKVLYPLELAKINMIEMSQLLNLFNVLPTFLSMLKSHNGGSTEWTWH